MLDSTDPNSTAAPAPRREPRADPELARQLLADVYYELVRTLRLTLPPPPTNTAEDLARRDRAAIERVAALAPANAAEAELAGQFVVASEQWAASLRLAHAPGTAPQAAAKCRTQAIAMMRQANSALGLLLSMQEAARKLDHPAAERLAQAEHRALHSMRQALAGQPAPVSAATARAAAQQAPAAAIPAPASDDSEAALIAAAERYAAAYPKRAAAIRRTGQLPPDVVYFCPPEAALAHALRTGRTPALMALDGLAEPPANPPASPGIPRPGLRPV